MSKKDKFKKDRNTLQDAYNATYGGQDLPDEAREAIRQEFQNYQSSDPDKNLVVREDGSLQYAGFKLSPVGIEDYGDDLEKFGTLLAHLDTAVQWWIGDFLVHAERAYGQTYEEIAEHFGFEVKTVYQYKWIAEKVELSVRTEKLSFTHHQLVAKFSNDPSKQRHWLARAEEEGWSVKKLREAIKAAEDGEPEQKTEAERRAHEAVATVRFVSSKVIEFGKRGKPATRQEREDLLPKVEDAIVWLESLRDQLK